MLHHVAYNSKVNITTLVVMLFVLTSGCSIVSEYQAEECCPTDLRHTYGHCSSEAVRRMPCYTDEADFGVKATVWRCNTGHRPQSPCPCVDNCGAGYEAIETGTPPHATMPTLQSNEWTSPTSVLAPRYEYVQGSLLHGHGELQREGDLQTDSPFASPPNPFRQ